MRTYVVPALLILSFTAWPAAATADCVHSWMHSPLNTTTPTAWLILEGGGDVEPYLLGLGDPRFTRVSGRHEVAATVVAVNKGRLNVVQTILKPMTPLKVGKKHTSLSHQGHGIARGLRHGLSRLAWKVEAATPRATWQAAPVAAGGVWGPVWLWPGGPQPRRASFERAGPRRMGHGRTGPMTVSQPSHGYFASGYTIGSAWGTGCVPDRPPSRRANAM